ncbi:hypothetical protein PYCC9005_005636 [Savitreella phatthalungensis]
MNLASLFSRTKPVVSLFHAPASPPSKAALTLLKSLVEARERGEGSGRPVELEVSEGSPTATQLSSILGFRGAEEVGKVVKGSVGAEDAAKLMKKRPESLTRPLVVDWGNGKALVGDECTEAKIRTLVDGI